MTAKKPLTPWKPKVPLFPSPLFDEEQWERIKRNGDVDDNARTSIEGAALEFKTYTSALADKPSPSASRRELKSLQNKARNLYESIEAASGEIKASLRDALEVKNPAIPIMTSYLAYAAKIEEIQQLCAWLDKAKIEDTLVIKGPNRQELNIFVEALDRILKEYSTKHKTGLTQSTNKLSPLEFAYAICEAAQMNIEENAIKLAVRSFVTNRNLNSK